MNDEQRETISLAILNSHLANERTHLAYLRTSLSMISFGVTINRLSTYLKHLDQLSFHFLLHDAASFGIGMVVMGIALQIWSMVRYRQVNQDITNSTFRNPEKSIPALTVIIVLLGILSILWMLTTNSVKN